LAFRVRERVRVPAAVRLRVRVREAVFVRLRVLVRVADLVRLGSTTGDRVDDGVGSGGEYDHESPLVTREPG